MIPRSTGNWTLAREVWKTAKLNISILAMVGFKLPLRAVSDISLSLLAASAEAGLAEASTSREGRVRN